MQVKIQVLSVSINHIPNAKGGYDVAEVAYKDLKDGKVNGKKIMSFLAKDVFDTIKKAGNGDIFDVTIEKEMGKDGKEYWQWKAVIASAADSAPAVTKQAGGATSTPVRSTYETPEERAIKQNLIVRQSCLNNALSYFEVAKIKPSAEDVKLLAEDFTRFIYSKDVADAGFESFESDIPF